MKECPCVNCPCIAICRLKTYRKMIGSCSLVINYIDSVTWNDNQPHLPYHRIHVRDAIDPVLWNVEDDTGTFVSRNRPDYYLEDSV